MTPQGDDGTRTYRIRIARSRTVYDYQDFDVRALDREEAESLAEEKARENDKYRGELRNAPGWEDFNEQDVRYEAIDVVTQECEECGEEVTDGCALCPGCEETAREAQGGGPVPL